MKNYRQRKFVFLLKLHQKKKITKKNSTGCTASCVFGENSESHESKRHKCIQCLENQIIKQSATNSYFNNDFLNDYVSWNQVTLSKTILETIFAEYTTGNITFLYVLKEKIKVYFVWSNKDNKQLGLKPHKNQATEGSFKLIVNYLQSVGLIVC